jgi:hypothetical protein
MSNEGAKEKKKLRQPQSRSIPSLDEAKLTYGSKNIGASEYRYVHQGIPYPGPPDIYRLSRFALLINSARAGPACFR